MYRNLSTVILLVLLFVVHTPIHAAQDRDIAGETARYAELVLRQWKIPGMSLAVVHNG